MILMIAVGICTVLYAEETDDFDWLLKGEWFLEMTDDGDYVYWHVTPKATFRRFDIPKGTPIYRGLTDFGRFNYYYPIGTDNMVRIGYDYDEDGVDDILEINTRDNYSYFMVGHKTESSLPRFLGGGIRKGDKFDSKHPFIGVWMTGDVVDFEVRLVEPDDYRYFLQIDKIPSFAYKQGWYLLKYLGNGVFESEPSFSEGHLRFELKKSGRILITPLFEKTEGTETLVPIQMRPWDNIPPEYFKKYGSEEKLQNTQEPVPVAMEQSKEQIPATTSNPVAKSEATDPVASGIGAGDSNTTIYIIIAAAAVIILAAAAVLLLRKRHKDA